MAQFFTVHPTHPQPRLIRQAAEILRDGGVIAYPTDSSYALGCRLDDAAATKRIRDIRGIDERHPLTLVCRDLADAGRFARLANWQFRMVRQGIPGSYTFLLPATREVPRRLVHPKRSTIGIRVPDHPVVTALLDALAEPILSSTLMLAGETLPLNEPEAIRNRLEHAVDLVVDAGPCSAEFTTVVDLAVDPPVIVRQGVGDPLRLGLASVA
ncbi:MAG: threonylcarbamoyl-AMP synthase [Betaproteobacteria bacterium]|nr:threonylcarbamoyl-AMP synthase [Betaproteobacteria bacterium]